MFACVIALIVYQLGLAFTGSIQIGGLIAAVILIAGLLICSSARIMKRPG